MTFQYPAKHKYLKQSSEQFFKFQNMHVMRASPLLRLLAPAVVAATSPRAAVVGPLALAALGRALALGVALNRENRI